MLLKTIFIDRLKNCGDFLLVQFLGPFWFRRLKGAFLCWCHIKLGFIIPKRSYHWRECRSSKVMVAPTYVRPCSLLKVHHIAHWSLFFFFLHAQSGSSWITHFKTICIEAGGHMHRKKGDFSVSTKHHSRHLRQQGNHDAVIWEEATTTFYFFYVYPETPLYSPYTCQWSRFSRFLEKECVIRDKFTFTICSSICAANIHKMDGNLYGSSNNTCSLFPIPFSLHIPDFFLVEPSSSLLFRIWSTSWEPLKFLFNYLITSKFQLPVVSLVLIL